MKVEYARRALADLDRISQHYLTVADPAVAKAFAARLQAVLQRLSQHPQSARPVIERPGVRVALMGRFPYKIFYRVLRDRIKVLHIRHMSRRPWKA